MSAGTMDYSAENGTRSIYIGNNSVAVPYTILFDDVDEPLELFHVQLSVQESFVKRIILGAINNTSVCIIDDDGMLVSDCIIICIFRFLYCKPNKIMDK